ncbi:MAG: CHRD domain-containing protein [Actinomycetota bacterium]
MKKLAIAVSVSLLALLPFVGLQASSGGGSKGRNTFNARLAGYNEVPSVSTSASGRFTAKVNRADEEISYKLRYEDLEGPVLFAHIHLGQKGANGGVSAFLCGGGHADPCPQEGEVRGVIGPDDVVGPDVQGIDPGEFDELVDAMKAGVTYANVHSERFPGGEIRGQIHKR